MRRELRIPLEVGHTDALLLGAWREHAVIRGHDDVKARMPCNENKLSLGGPRDEAVVAIVLELEIREEESLLGSGARGQVRCFLQQPARITRSSAGLAE